jgi:4-amino-4-deoxy-L-arabinose transferase-like glycosyltransferase
VSSRRSLLLLPLLLLTGLGLWLRLTGIDAASLWFDEWITVEQSTRPSLWEALGASTTHPPLLRVLVRGSIALFGDLAQPGGVDGAARLPGALLGAATVPLLFFLGRRLSGGDARVGLLTAALYAVSPFGLYYAQEARYYAPVVFFATWTLLATPRWVEAPRQIGRGLSLFFALLLGVHTHHLFGLLFVLSFGWITPYVLREPRRRLSLVLPWLGAGVLFLPWFFYAMAHLEPQGRPWIAGLEQQFLDSGVAFFTGRIGALHLVGIDGRAHLTALGAGAWALLGTGLLVHGVRRRGLPPGRPGFSYGLGGLTLAAAALTFAAVAHQAGVSTRFFHHKYLAFLLPLLYLGLAELILALLDAPRQRQQPRRGRRRGTPLLAGRPQARATLWVLLWVGATTATLLAAAPLLGPTVEAFERYRPGSPRPFHRERYRAAARWVDAHRRPGDVVVIFDPYRQLNNATLLAYYGVRPPRVVYRHHQLQARASFWARHPETLLRARRLLVVTAHCDEQTRQTVERTISWGFPRLHRRIRFPAAEGTIQVSVRRPAR